jgi:hypothetical protein
MWAWDNYEDAKKVYDELVSERACLRQEAAKIAVLHAANVREISPRRGIHSGGRTPSTIRVTRLFHF